MQNPSSEHPRRQFVTASIAALAGTASVVAMPSRVHGQSPDASSPGTRSGIYPGRKTPPGNVGYAPGNLAIGRQVVFVSGQGPKDLDADMETQMRQTFDRIGEVLKEAGATFADVVMLRAYFVHLQRDLPILREVRLEYLGTPAPAATSIGVSELASPGLEIEIEAIAVL